MQVRIEILELLMAMEVMMLKARRIRVDPSCRASQFLWNWSQRGHS